MKTNELTDEEMRLSIAIACGWRWEEPFNKRKASNRLIGPKMEVVTVWKDGLLGGESNLPDYLNNLDAMHEAEKCLTEEQQETYGYEFLQIVETERARTVGKHGFQVAHVSARQRARAFLATLNPPTPNP